MRDPYEVLGLNRNATQDQIVKAYRSLASKYHPDKNPENAKVATERFKEISAAFELIGDESRRKNFDSFRSGQPSFSFRNRNSVDDFFNNIYSQFFGDQKKSSNCTRARVKITLEEAFTGCIKKINSEKHKSCESCVGTGSSSWIPCAKCEGKGFVFSDNGPMRIQVSCSFCFGKGSVSSESCKGCEGKGYVVDFVKTLNVKIPAGIEDENQIRLAGEAADGNDLFLIVNVEKHPVFRREDKFLVGQIEVPYSTLVLGGEIDMDLFGTKILVKISPRTKTGTKLRLKKQGMPSLQNPNLRGDLLLDVVLRMPQLVTRDHEKILARLAKIEKYN